MCESKGKSVFVCSYVEECKTLVWMKESVQVYRSVQVGERGRCRAMGFIDLAPMSRGRHADAKVRNPCSLYSALPLMSLFIDLFIHFFITRPRLVR